MVRAHHEVMGTPRDVGRFGAMNERPHAPATAPAHVAARGMRTARLELDGLSAARARRRTVR
jgi:hypothetical protein